MPFSETSRQAIMALKGWDVGDRELVATVADAVKNSKNWQARQRRQAAYLLASPL